MKLAAELIAEKFLRIFQHLLPNARAWRIATKKQLRAFFSGLTGIGSEFKTFSDNIYDDIFPDTTRNVDAWESQFGLRDSGLSDPARRSRLDAAWKALGGQSPRYIQDTLRANGFDVAVREWWYDNGGILTAYNPLDIIAPDNQTPVPERGYPLVNLVGTTRPNYFVQCGEPLAACGEPTALFGNYDNFVSKQKPYYTSTDPAEWPYYIYIGGYERARMANVPAARRTEFETLCLKLCPAQQWLGMNIIYT